MGRQCRGGPGGGGLDTAHDAELSALGDCVRYPAAFHLAAALAHQFCLDQLQALRGAGPAGGGLLQRADVPGAAHLHAAECDAGGGQHAGVDAGHRRNVFQAAHHAHAGGGRFAVDSRCGGGAVARPDVLVGKYPLCTGRLLHGAGQRCLGVLQLVAEPAERRPRNPQQLGGLFNGANGLWPGLGRPAHRR